MLAGDAGLVDDDQPGFLAFHAVPSILRPVWMALEGSLLYHTVQHYNCLTFLLPDHGPEVIDCVTEWPLGQYVASFYFRDLDETRVDIVCFGNTFQRYSAVVVWKDVSVSIVWFILSLKSFDVGVLIVP